MLGHSGGYERRGYSGFSRARLTRAGLALLQYKQAHGAFPETLDALGLEGLINPYAEEPLHYRPEGDPKRDASRLGTKARASSSTVSARTSKDNNGTPEPREAARLGSA